MSKPCTRCGETKPLTDFHRRAAASDGRKSTCKSCSRAYLAARRAERGDDIRAKERASRKRRRVDKVQPVRPDRCHYAGCRKTARHDGLCDAHHASLTACQESPLALAGGQWVAGKGGVRRWVG